jgi:hypothetical protein
MLALLLGACSADLSVNSVTLKPETVLNPSGWTTISVPLKNNPNLLTAEGQCSAAGSDQEPVPLGHRPAHDRMSSREASRPG